MPKDKEVIASSKSSIQDRIAEYEAEIANTKYNKKTQHSIGILKAKIAQLKEKAETRASSQKAGLGFGVRKSGDATVVILGFPSVGKSTLLNDITNAKSLVGAYDFTTLDVIPGLLEINHAKIQILDIPGIVYGAAEGRGRGREVLSMVRAADLLMILIDVQKPKQYDFIANELYSAKIRINQKAPDVKIARTALGGIRIGSTVRLTKLTKETIKAMLLEMRVSNADVVLRTDCDADQFIDAVEANRTYMNAITVVNKIDTATQDQIYDVQQRLKPDLMISATDKTNTEQLKQLIFERLNFVRIYLKQPGKEPDMKEPLIMRKPATMERLCERLHREFINKFRFARVWGKSSRFPGQRLLRLDHELEDKDIVEIHLR
jgi:uncharacterized protein